MPPSRHAKKIVKLFFCFSISQGLTLRVLSICKAAEHQGKAFVQAANFLNLQQLFYSFILPFIAFFGLFPYAIYPNIDALHPTSAFSTS
jgi:hypothetical protein